MKQMTIWQRLNTALILLIILLLVGVGLALWVEESRSSALHRGDHLSAIENQLQEDLLHASDALRGLILDPTNEAERRRLRDSMDKCRENLEIDHHFREHRDLTKAAKDLRDYAIGPFAAFQTRVLEMLESDPVSATTYHNRNYPQITLQRDQLLRELARNVELVKKGESNHAQTISIVGLTCIVVILLASLLVGRLQSSAVTEPLKRLVATLDRMRQGDFTQRLDWTRQDEFGILSQGLNRLADDLSALVGQVQRSGLQVNTTAAQIAATAREQQTTAHEIAATTAEIGATSKEISSTSKELVNTMNEVSQVAEQTAGLAGSGQAAITSMESIMRHIMESSGAITAKLAVLNEKTTNINSMVTTITKVADQTNLLSLNAAIEAEKAGEYGLGFAVVAMEIRRLADQTAVATYDIEKMVKEMQSAVTAGVFSMDKFSEDVRRGAGEIRHVGTHLAQIISQVQTLTPRFQTVNEGMHAQAAGAQQISETLTQLSEAASQTAESLKQSNNAIDQLNGAARGLQTSVARFRLVDSSPAPAGNGEEKLPDYAAVR